MPAFEAALLGLIGGSALLIGAAAGFWLALPQRVLSGVMALGAGVLVSVIAFDLVERAYSTGGVALTGLGLLAGAIIFALCNTLVSVAGGEHRKRSGCNPCAQQDPKAGLAIALGTLLDGVPESFVIGIGSLDGTHQNTVTVAAFFVANIPEALSSASGMSRSGRGAFYVFGVWSAIALASGLAALLGHFSFSGAPAPVIALALSLAAGAILAMLIDTMIPEAAEGASRFNGVLAVTGFLAAFGLAKLLG
jgi:ZIP family zinc transporter